MEDEIMESKPKRKKCKGQDASPCAYFIKHQTVKTYGVSGAVAPMH